eukprot:m.47732 g.47732  ORF g.47732 m.47732 type:complete len:225 (+) comp10785_c0_seq7:48-722(+)
MNLHVWSLLSLVQKQRCLSYAINTQWLYLLSSVHASAASLFEQFGIISVLDLLTNNFDRIPLVWSNQGNFENLMVQGNVFEDDGKLTAASIDQGTTCITNAKGEEEYRQKIIDCIKEAHAHDVDVKGKTFKRFKMSFENNTGYEFKQVDCENYFKGVREGCERLKNLIDADNDFVYKNVQKAIDFLSQTEAVGIQTGLGLLNGDFVQKNVEAILKTAAEAKSSS